MCNATATGSVFALDGETVDQEIIPIELDNPGPTTCPVLWTAELTRASQSSKQLAKFYRNYSDIVALLERPLRNDATS